MKATNNAIASFIHTCQNVHFLGSMAVAAAPQMPTEKLVNWLFAEVDSEVEHMISLLENIEDIKPRLFSRKKLKRTRQTLKFVAMQTYFAKQSPYISMPAFNRFFMQIKLQMDSIIRDIPNEVMEVVA